MNIKIPVKHLIANADSQARLLEDDGTPYTAADATPSAGGFILEGFLPLILGSELELLAATTRIRSEAASAGAAGAIRIELAVDSGAIKGDIFHVRVKNPELVPTEFQQYIPLEKRYQLSGGVAAATDSDHSVASQVVATINADKHAHVTAAVVAGVGNEGVIEITAKEVGQSVEFYVSQENEAGGLTLATAPVVLTYDTGVKWTVQTVASNSVNDYEYLKNIDWARDLDFDRNVEFQPEYGASYTAYYFEANWSPKDIGGHTVPSIAPEQQAGRTAFKVWVKDGLALKTAMDLLVTDMNV